jgi:hypothetical protein
LQRGVILSRVAELPVHDIADGRLADAFGLAGCPICRYATRSAGRFVDGMLDESVNDRGFRAELDAARGFCRRHTREVLLANRRHSGGSLAAAILFAAIARIRKRELDGISSERGRSRSQRITQARHAPACPVCAQAASAETTAAARLIELAREPAWAGAMGAAAFCVDHLMILMSRGGTSLEWRAVEAAQTARIERLRERLDGFAHHSSQDRRHLMTEEERTSADEAATLLGGTPPD